ncbi:MAG TPA: S1C family serine protease [Xanthobacteraceae bacterium]|nr:S1C family serine protease [Xanthobacteraceae bacterium]
MPSLSDWNVPPDQRPKAADYDFDLEAAMSAVVGLRAMIPEDAFTAQMLGTERAGNGVLIRDSGLVLTIGYLITEAETIWLSPGVGPPVPGHALAYDQETGFGLVQALARLDLPVLPIGSSGNAQIGERVVVAGAGGRQRSVAARIVAKQEFAGYWEYVLDEAFFTAPAHPNWGGTAMIGAAGELLGIGSLQLEQGRERGGADHLNMIVPIDLLKPILDDLLRHGRPNRPPRPWLGLYAAEIDDRIVVIGLADRGPAQRAGLRTGDVVQTVGGEDVRSLAGMFRQVWSLGRAGVEIPIRLDRDGHTQEHKIASADRSRFFKAPRLH